jgi:hypothetical protein
VPGVSGAQALWGVPSALAARDHLLELGATLLEDVQEVGEDIKVGAVRAPFGNRLGFIENPHFRMDAVR